MAPPCKLGVPPPDVEHGREPVSSRELSEIIEKKEGTHAIGRCVAHKSARLNFQSAAADVNCSSLKQFKFPPHHMQHRAGSERVYRGKITALTLFSPFLFPWFCSNVLLKIFKLTLPPAAPRAAMAPPYNVDVPPRHIAESLHVRTSCSPRW